MYWIKIYKPRSGKLQIEALLKVTCRIHVKTNKLICGGDFMKKVILIGLLTLVVAFAGQTALGDSSLTQTFYGVQEVSLSVANHDEKRILTFPEKPLGFISKIFWEVSFEKNGIFTNKKAAIQIEVISADGKTETVASLNPEHKESGELTLQPDQVCRLTLYAGKYNSVFKKYGANMKALCKFQKSQVNVYATEMNGTGRFKLDVASIPPANWDWTLPDGNRVTNNTITTSFSAGSVVIQLSNHQNADTFQFNLQVPESVEANPSVAPLDGYEDLTVHSFANIVNHYQSTSKYFWDFGDQTAVKTAEQAEHTYSKPGVYQVKLKVINSLGSVIEKTWSIQVRPFTIENGATVAPGRGPIPLTIFYEANPVILGTEPNSIQYLWHFGDGAVSKLPSGEHVYRKVGDYPVQLTIVDKNHPNLKIEPWTYIITVTPPILILTADASRWSGTIPLRIKFRSNLKVEGGPTDVDYYWDFNDGTYSSEINPIHAFIDPGHYQVRLTVTDRIYGTVVTKHLPIDVKPPELSLKVLTSQNSGVIPVPVKFTPILDVDGGPTQIEYFWDFNDGTTERTFTPSPVSHTFSQPGLYTVTITARDRIYHTSVSSRVKIEVKTPLIISRSNITPLTGNAPLQTIGMGNADVQGSPSQLQYTWYVDGQKYSYDREFRYLFKEPGTHKVTLTIIDTLPGHTGRSTQSWDVMVQNNQAAPTTAPGNSNTPPVATATPPVFDNNPAAPAPTPASTPAPVKDTKPPQLTVALSPNKLTPPNRKMIQIAADIKVSDDQDPDPEIRLLSITCNQTIDPNVDISGASIGTDDRSFFLRSEMDGNKHEDRIYTVTYSATDRSGNSKTVTGTVIVPFSARDERNDRDHHDKDHKNNKNGWDDNHKR
jgi:PKD repeat protein